MKRKSKTKQNISGLILLTATLVGCTNVDFSKNAFQGNGVANPNGKVCSSESFTQPSAPITNSVDILFVTHTTQSFTSVRQTVINGLDQFVAQLPANSDFQVGVMLAHNPGSSLSGTLYAPAGGQAVLSSKNMTIDQIKTNLTNNLANPPEPTSGSGEEGLASFYTSMDSAHLSAIRAQGFYRPGAALAVIFLANEADMCGLPSTDPGTDGDYAQEIITKQNDCNGITPESVLQRAVSLQNDSPLLIGAVTYVNKTQAALPSGVEAEYGWGYMDTVNLLSGPAVDINSNIPTGLAGIGKLISLKLNLKTDFFPKVTNLDPNSITVTVDGSNAAFTYDATSNDVHLSQPGNAGSQVKISYCQ